MRLRNKILAMAVVAVAGFNTYLANDIRVQRNELSMLNLENIAEAQEEEPVEGREYNEEYFGAPRIKSCNHVPESEKKQGWVYLDRICNYNINIANICHEACMAGQTTN